MRSILPSFRYPKCWEKLQRVTYDLRKQCGLPDTRVDCVANSLAFVGAMDRDSAEELAKTLNSRGYGVQPYDVIDYMTGHGHERIPHYIQHITPETYDIEQVYSFLKEGYGTLICLNRTCSMGHMATVIKFGGQLAVYDPQTEMLSYNVKDWLNNQSAASVDLIVRVNKVSHMLEESAVSVRNPHETDTKRIRVIAPLITPTKTNQKSKEYIRKKEKSFIQFVNSVQEAGFDYNQLARL